MTNLTERWKKGELEINKDYFIKFNSQSFDGTEFKIDRAFLGTYDEFYYHYSDCDEHLIFDNDVIEVLAPVPSYDHFVELTEKVKENNKLKELLKEWVKFYPIVLYEYEDTLKTKDIIELREKTVEVLNVAED